MICQICDAAEAAFIHAWRAAGLPGDPSVKLRQGQKGGRRQKAAPKVRQNTATAPAGSTTKGTKRGRDDPSDGESTAPAVHPPADAVSLPGDRPRRKKGRSV